MGVFFILQKKYEKYDLHPFGMAISVSYTLVKTIKGLLLFSFVYNSSINEHKNLKLKENTGYERIN